MTTRKGLPKTKTIPQSIKIDKIERNQGRTTRVKEVGLATAKISVEVDEQSVDALVVLRAHKDAVKMRREGLWARGHHLIGSLIPIKY